MQWLFRMSDWLRHRARLRQENVPHAWGKRGEDLAHRFLQRKGYVVVARNHRSRGGSAEVDLVAIDGATLVFVEVKTRATDLFGAPEEAVNTEKRRKIISGAADYIYRSGNSWDNVRFDVVSVLFGQGDALEHHRDAFRPPASL